MTSRLTKLMVLVASTELLLFGMPAYAQQPEYDQPETQAQDPATQYPEAQEPAATDVSDEEIEAFAKAQDELDEISAEWQGKMQDMSSPEDIREAQDSAHEEKVKVLESVGLTVADYNRISRAVQNDPSLQQRIAQYQRG